MRLDSPPPRRQEVAVLDPYVSWIEFFGEMLATFGGVHRIRHEQTGNDVE